MYSSNYDNLSIIYINIKFMDFQFTESEKNFKNEVRDFTKKNLSTELKNKSLHYQTMYIRMM